MWLAIDGLVFMDTHCIYSEQLMLYNIYIYMYTCMHVSLHLFCPSLWTQLDLRLIVKSLGPSSRQCLRHLWPLSLQQLERRVRSPSVLPQSRLLHLKALRKIHPTKHPQKRANLWDQHLLHLHHPTIPIRVLQSLQVFSILRSRLEERL